MAYLTRKFVFWRILSAVLLTKENASIYGNCLYVNGNYFHQEENDHFRLDRSLQVDSTHELGQNSLRASLVVAFTAQARKGILLFSYGPCSVKLDFPFFFFFLCIQTQLLVYLEMCHGMYIFISI